MQSSATLGTGKPSTHLRRLEKEEDLDVRRALDGRAGKGKRRRNDAPPSAAGDSEESDEDAHMNIDRPARHTREDENVQEGMSRSRPVVIVDSGFSTVVQSSGLEDSVPSTSVIGSALRHNPHGTTAVPKISKRKPKHSKVESIVW